MLVILPKKQKRRVKHPSRTRLFYYILATMHWPTVNQRL